MVTEMDARKKELDDLLEARLLGKITQAEFEEQRQKLPSLGKILMKRGR